MNVDELVDRLAAFGIEGNEARAYYHLSRRGASTAAELAKAADLPRTDVYRLMDGLEEQGLVERTLASPTEFVPQPIGDALERRIEDRAKEVERLETLADDLREAWPRPRDRGSPDGERVSIHKGDQQVKGLLERMVADADEKVLIVCPKRSLARFGSMGLKEDVAARAEEGADVRVLTEVDETNLETARDWAEGVDVRHADLPSYLQEVIVDASALAQFVAVDPLTSVSRSGLTALRLTSTDFILAQEALFDQLWERGFDLEARARELETGEPVPHARVVRGRWLLFGRLETLAQEAEETLRLAVGDLDLEHPGPRDLEEVLARRVDGSLEVRVLGGPEAPVPAEAERRDPGSWPRGLEAVADDREVLCFLGAGETGPWALHSTLEDEVRRTCQRFDEAWSAADG